MILAALNGSDGIAEMKAKKEKEEREKHIRTKEDPELVGEEAAKKAREERLKWENRDVLEKEDKRWEWFLGQMEDWKEREISWKGFKEEQEEKMKKGVKGRLGWKRGI